MLTMADVPNYMRTKFQMTDEQIEAWVNANNDLSAKIDACANSEEFKAWLAGLDDKCAHCPAADGRFSGDELTRRRSLTACKFNCPRVLVLSYWEEKGIDY